MQTKATIQPGLFPGLTPGQPLRPSRRAAQVQAPTQAPADPEALRQDVRDALNRARQEGRQIRGIIAHALLQPEMRDWAAKRGWEQSRAHEAAQFIAPASPDEHRSWMAYGSVSLLISVPRIALDGPGDAALTVAAPSTGRRLRGYQVQTIASVHREWDAGTRSVLVRLPTGTGKSVVISKIATEHVNAGGVVVLMAHRIELIDQLADHMQAEGVPAAMTGKLMTGHRPKPGQTVIVSTVQSSRKLRDLMGEQYAGMPLLVVIDEAHRSASNQYVQALRDLAPDRVLGVTATPTRTDGRGLGDLFGAMVGELTYAESFEAHDDNGGQPYLIRPTYYCPTIPDLSSVRMKAGDYDDTGVADVMMQPTIVGSVVEHALKYASERLTIAFCATVKHALAMSNALNAAGLMAEVVSGDTDKDERADRIARFRRGEFSVLVNVAIATEGLDVPEVDCVINARPTRSVALWMQMIGRGMRPAAGKTDFIVLDHGGTFLDLGPVEAYEEWTLAATKEANAKKKCIGHADTARSCRCGNTWIGGPRCPACGAVANSKNWHAENAAALNAELVLAQSLEDPALRQSRLKKQYSTAQREEIYYQMRRYATSKGMSPDAAFYWYKHLFGCAPSNTFMKASRPVTPEYAAIFQQVADDLIAQFRARKKASAGQEYRTEAESTYPVARLEELYQMMIHYAGAQTKSGKVGQAYHWYRELFDSPPMDWWRNEPLEPDDEALELIRTHLAWKARQFHAIRKASDRRHHPHS